MGRCLTLVFARKGGTFLYSRSSFLRCYLWIQAEDDILRAMETFDREHRGTFPPNRWVTYAVKHNGKLYPPKEIIRIATGMRDIGPGGQPVNSRFRELGF